MVRYRRSRVQGGTYFFTLTLRDRRSDALVRRIDALRASWRAAAGRVPHPVVAVVVLPEHLHAQSPSPWQARFWKHTARDAADLQAHVDYVHINP